MLELAGALNDAGEPVALNQARMERIAAAYDVTHARVAVLPNMVLAAGGRGAPTALELTHLQLSTNRLDKTAAIDNLARDAERAAIDPEDGLRRLDEIAAMRHRFGTAGVIGGHMVLTLGLALILQPTPEALAAAAVFGALIGALKIYARDLQTVGVLLPIAAATLISALAFWIAPDQTIDGSMRILIPALVTFIPGSLLTTATLDLSAGEVISGSSRLVAGTMQLVLLSFGIAVGALIAGVSLDEALTNEAKNTLGDWAPWLGVIVFGIGAFVHFSGPPRSLGWLLVVLLAAWIGQQIGGHLVSDTLGAFFGALIATPVAAWVAHAPLGATVAGLVPARVLAARTRRGRPDRHGRVRRLQSRGRARPLRQLPDHLHLDRDRRAGRQRDRPPMDPTMTAARRRARRPNPPSLCSRSPKRRRARSPRDRP